MPEYLSPGVYMEEVEIGPRPIQGVSTSTAGMVGVTQWGPEEGLPELVTSFAEYRAKFGGFLEEEKWGNARFLPYAVQGFFQNGGQRVYIKRVVGKNASESALQLGKGIVAQLKEDFFDSGMGLKSARLGCLRGISVGTVLTFSEVDRNEQKHEMTVKVVSYNEDLGEVWFYRNNPSGYKFSKSGTLIMVSGNPVPVNITVKAKNKGKWGDRILLQIEPSGKGFSTMVCHKEDMVEFTLAAIKTTALKLKAKINPASGDVVNFELKTAADLRRGDVLEFRAQNKTFQRNVVNAEDKVITVDTAFPKEMVFEADDTAITLLTALRYFSLTLASDAAKGDTVIKLTDASNLKEKDLITLVNSAGEAEELEISSIAGNDVTLKVGTGFDYPAAGTKACHITRLVQADSTSGLSTGDRVLVSSTKDELVCKACIEDVDSTNKAIKLKFDNPGKLENVSLLTGDRIILKKAAKPGEKSVKFASVNSFYVGAQVELDNGIAKEYLTVEKIDEVNKSISFDKPLSGMYIDGDRAKLCEYKFTVSNIPWKDPVLTEVFDGLNLNNATKRYFAAVINSGSKLVNIVDGEMDSSVFPMIPTGFATYLQNGNDGEIPGDNDYKGNSDGGPGKRTGIKALEDIDDISIVAVPGITSQDVQNELINHCEIVMKDRFAILDSGKGMDIKGIRAQRSLYNTAYGAIYYPWLKIQDPITGKPADVPPCGHVTGIYARSDVQRGVHKAPANEVIQGITGLEVQINKGENDVLNSENINAIRAFPGRGIMVWGARTMSDNTLWKYINIRRLFLFIEESIEQNTQWVVFEPNNEKLWARVKLTINQFLTGVWRDGALMGTKEEEAFFIKCDRTTMTQDDLDNGRLIVEIGIAPVKPAEFVIFRIAQWTSTV
jgi:phage tail sheath protein FI